MSKKLTARIALGIAILAWLFMSVVDLSNQFSLINNLDSGFFEGLPNFLFLVYAIALFTFYKARVEIADRLNLIDLLWKIFVTGMLTTVVSLSIRSLNFIFGSTQLMQNVLVVDLLFLINLGLLAAFLIATLVVWKRLILYQKTKRLLMIWTVFEYVLFGSILLDFVSIPYIEYFLIIVVALGLYVSANMKWVAYLSFRQKWKSILLLMLILLYLVYFYMNLGTYRELYQFLSLLKSSIFIQAAFVFTSTYAVFSLLVILFNLPTTSAFEQKLNEVLNFQRLSQSIQTEKNEEQVFEILLDSAVRTSEADAAWIELKANEKYFLNNISYEKAIEVKSLFSERELGINYISDEAGKKRSGIAGKIKGGAYRSVAIFPIWVNELQEGKLYLLKEVRDGFTKELVEITGTFANQAGISIANFRMLNEALATERYKEELKIAKQVQTKLLPLELEANPDFEVSTFTVAADEVGGDYYDSFKIDEHRMALIIGDVSGKGTSAAFHMAQMKGIFLALAQMELTPSEFLEKANLAISSGLDKTSFVTISYFIIDSKDKSVEFARAGHAPSLYYSNKEKKAAYFENQGLGLGIIRGKKYSEYIQQSKFNYMQGDVLVLYTDGITEAKNNSNDEYGYDKLLNTIEKNATKEPVEIQKAVIEDLYSFCNNEPLQDDYSLVVIKFN